MFLQNLRAKVGARLNGDSESGFTLIELLVVMLILGILAAIALPAFFNQKDKAGDAKAKEYAHTGQVAIETWFTDNATYKGATPEKLKGIEPTLANAEFTVTDTGGVAGSEPDADSYRLTVESSNGNKFWVDNNGGTLTFECTTKEEGGCPSSGKWDS